MPFTRRGALGVAATAILGPAMCANAAKLTEEAAFRQEVVNLLRRRRPQWILSKPDDVEELIVVDASIPELVDKRFYLGNLRRAVDGLSAASREDEIIAFFDKLSAPSRRKSGRSFHDIKDRIKARVVSADFENLNYSPTSKLIVGPHSEKTRIAYVEDSDGLLGFVMHDEIEEWQITVRELHALAVANLDEASNHVEIEVETYDGIAGRYASFALHDSFDAARILAPNFLLRLRNALGPKIYIGIPNRDFMVCWAADFGHRVRFAEMVNEDEGKQAYPLTDELFVLTKVGIRLATAEELAEHGR